jgi:hypothetical protein
MRIGIYASARNEQINVEDWLKCVADADVVCVNDTGSTDATIAMFCKAPVRATQYTPDPMYLVDSLNYTMDQLPDDIDVAIRLDLDERLQPGWREPIEALDWSTRMSARPWYEHTDGTTWRHDRVHSRHGYKWRFPVHEELWPDGEGEDRRIELNMVIEHHQDPDKDRSQVLGELKAAYEAEPDNPRWPYYYGRELMGRGHTRQAIDILLKAAEADTFAEERSESWRLVGDCLVQSQPIQFVSDIPYRNSATICPRRREGWVSLAILYREQERWAECLAATEMALSITQRSWYPNHPFAWDDDKLTAQIEMLSKAVLQV